MAEFTPSKKTKADFNNNTQYRDYDPSIGQNGDAVQAATVNNLIESQLWTQALATNAPDTTQANVVGTPSVEIATATDGTPQLKFKNLKGATGTAAGFGTPTASVDANVGTPQVTVTASGANTAKVFNFAFKNIKGEKGADGRGISKITDYYAVSTSNTTIPTSFSTTVPTLTSTNKYLWNYQYITYTDGDAYRSAERVIGVYGDTGEVDASKYVTLDGDQNIDGLKKFKRRLTASGGLDIYEADQEKPVELQFTTQRGLTTSLLVDQDMETEPSIYLPDASGTIALLENVENALTDATQYTDDEIAAIETALTNYPKLTSSNAFTGNNYFTNGVYVGAPATSTTDAKDGIVNFYGNSTTSVLQLTADAASISGVKNVKLPVENGTLATQTFVNEKVANLVNSAPKALDTLNELAQALGNDANFATTVSTQLGNKVDKVSGKQLSTNDYTTAEKNKLAGITDGANKYVLPTATTSVLGGIKSGNDISVDTTGLVTVLDNSHNHTIANVTNLQTTLDAKYSATKPNFGTATPLMDGTATVGTATTYSRSDHKHPTDTSRASTAVATQSTNGLMSSTDKAKLDGIATDANNYTLPTASSSTLGGVKTTSTVTSSSGLTACPIISGVPYYKDTTYTFSSVSPTLEWGAKHTIGTAGNITYTVTMPANPNTDTGATSVAVSGSGNAVTTASYDASTRKLTLTKGTTFLTSHQDISGKLSLSGGTMTGNLKWASGTALPENTSPKYLVTIDAFAEGGTTKWVSIANVKTTLGVPTTYAGSSTAGGSATSAVKLDTSAGSATQPVYFSGGKPVATSYTLGASVPSGAKFTDTTYTVATQSANGLMSASDKTKLDSIPATYYHHDVRVSYVSSAGQNLHFQFVCSKSVSLTWDEIYQYAPKHNLATGYVTVSDIKYPVTDLTFGNLSTSFSIGYFSTLHAINIFKVIGETPSFTDTVKAIS